jgi:hypothetical protein
MLQSMGRTEAWWIWLLFVGIASPWVTAIIYYWRKRPRDGAIPPSMAEAARKRLWTS